MRQRQELSTEMIIWLQTTIGNRAVQRLLAKKKAQAAASATKRSRKTKFKWTWRYYWSLIVHLLSSIAVWQRR